MDSRSLVADFNNDDFAPFLFENAADMSGFIDLSWGLPSGNFADPHSRGYLQEIFPPEALALAPAQPIVNPPPFPSVTRTIDPPITSTLIHLQSLLNPQLKSPQPTTKLASPPEKVLGKGAFGKVILSRYQSMDVAIKIMHPKNKDGVLDCRNEAKVLSELTATQSQYIIKFIDSKELPGSFEIIMEYACHGSLGNFLKSNPNLPWETKLGCMLQSTNGVIEVHYHDYIHCDLKPGNFLLCEGSDGFIIKVADFGLATHINSHNQKGRGTFFFSAPEILVGKENTHASDVYSLGVSLLNILTQKTPYKNFNTNMSLYKHLMAGKRAFIPRNNPTCPQFVRDIIRDCCVTDPKLRPAAYDVGLRLFNPPPTKAPASKKRALSETMLEEGTATKKFKNNGA